LFARAHILGIFVAKQPIFRFSAVVGGGFSPKILTTAEKFIKKYDLYNSTFLLNK
jgi:hypothetical protein